MEADIDLEGLEEHEIESWQVDPISKIYPLLRGGLFHRTSIEGYRGIRSSGRILSNRGQFSFTYPQSKHSLAFSKGWVSLFDFGPVTDKHCIWVHDTWGQFFFDQVPCTIVFRLNRDFLSPKLIPNSWAPKPGDTDCKIYIPYVEAWYPEPIPLEAVEGYVLVWSEKPTMFKVINEQILSDDHLEKYYKKFFYSLVRIIQNPNTSQQEMFTALKALPTKVKEELKRQLGIKSLENKFQRATALLRYPYLTP